MSHASIPSDPARGLFIAGQWQPGRGEPFTAINPATGEAIWRANAASDADVAEAVAAGRAAFPAWMSRPLDDRAAIIDAFTQRLADRRDELAWALSEESGKPFWEARTELGAMIGKAAITREAFAERCAERRFDLPGFAKGEAHGVTAYRPHGVVAVFGPYNFPGHVPNGHIVPALLAGNTVVFKPSELTPRFAELTVQCWADAGLPPGVLNLVQGGKDTGVALADPDRVDGVFFTGSAAVGVAINKRFAEHPGKVLALELGGNNPLIVHNASDTDAAAYWAVHSAFATAGQRCTCASRVIVTGGEASGLGDRFVDRFVEMASRLRIGAPVHPDDIEADGEPFAGPVIRSAMATRLLEAQQGLSESGATALLPMRALDSPGQAMLSPGIMDVTPMPPQRRSDHELFGPIVQLLRVDSLEQAIDEANNTRYGLAAGLLCDDRDDFERFMARIRAGVIAWNRPTTGASSRNPFGGVGDSGNHRPAGYFAVDYCSYAVGAMEVSALKLPAKRTPGVVM